MEYSGFRPEVSGGWGEVLPQPSSKCTTYGHVRRHYSEIPFYRHSLVAGGDRSVFGGAVAVRPSAAGLRVVPGSAGELRAGFCGFRFRGGVREAVILMISARESRRSRMAPAVGISPRSFPQSSTGRLEVMSVDRVS